MKNGSSSRVLIGCIILGFVWALYLMRVLWGVGPMRDHQGDQGPAWHYLVGAAIVTAMVTAWIVLRRRWEQK